jgi:hypothetical protein
MANARDWFDCERESPWPKTEQSDELQSAIVALVKAIEQEDTPGTASDLRPYISGADVMATWHRCTGWIPPSRDPRYIKKWLDFQLEMLDSRRRAIEAQFSLNFLKGTDDETRNQPDCRTGSATDAVGGQSAFCAPLHEAPPVGQSWSRHAHDQDNDATHGAWREAGHADALAQALDARPQSFAISDAKFPTN